MCQPGHSWILIGRQDIKPWLEFNNSPKTDGTLLTTGHSEDTSVHWLTVEYQKQTHASITEVCIQNESSTL